MRQRVGSRLDAEGPGNKMNAGEVFVSRLQGPKPFVVIVSAGSEIPRHILADQPQRLAISRLKYCLLEATRTYPEPAAGTATGTVKLATTGGPQT